MQASQAGQSGLDDLPRTPCRPAGHPLYPVKGPHNRALQHLLGATVPDGKRGDGYDDDAKDTTECARDGEYVVARQDGPHGQDHRRGQGRDDASDDEGPPGQSRVHAQPLEPTERVGDPNLGAGQRYRH